ncbi:hypothetical protein H4582DRAFT_1447223 [Lactarius indigo]|nr:hypothetical protein H4582DRAFT_1447223 [Lactarius indigo]
MSFLTSSATLLSTTVASFLVSFSRYVTNELLVLFGVMIRPSVVVTPGFLRGMGTYLPFGCLCKSRGCLREVERAVIMRAASGQRITCPCGMAHVGALDLMGPQG